jgi:hypothetical protein
MTATISREIPMNRRLATLACAALTSACATAPAAPKAPPGLLLGYSAAAPGALTYEFSDSSGFTIQGGAIGNIEAIISGAGTAVVHSAAAPEGVTMTVSLADFNGSFTNSAGGGTTNATEADVVGSARISVSPRGVVTVNELPFATRAAQSVGIGANFFRRFTLRLPGARVQRGASWVDTVAVTEDNAGAKAAVRDIVTSTWARDTVVAGRTLLVVTHTTQRTLDISGTSEGVQIAQHLTGTSSGVTLWDAQSNAIVSRTETTDLSGTFDLPAMAVTGLPVKAAGKGRITLR